MSLFDENKFNEALILINEILSYEDIDLSEEIHFLKFKVRIFEILNIENVEMINDLASRMSELNEYDESRKLLNKIDNKNINTLKKLWSSCVGAGDVFNSEKYGQEYLSALYGYKRYKQMLSFLEEYVASGGSIITGNIFKLRAIIGLGDINQLDDNFFNNDLQKYLDGKNISGNLPVYELFLELTRSKRRFWKTSKTYHEVRILVALVDLDHNENRKNFINEIFDRLLQFPEVNEWYQLLAKYALQFERKKLGLGAINLLTECKDILKVKHGLIKKLNELKKSLEILPDIKEEIKNVSSDSRTDLFKFKSEKDNALDKISKLERDIKFVRELGDKESLEILYLELKKIDENNECLRDYYNAQYKEKASRSKISRKNVNEIESDLLNEIGKYCSDRISEEDERASLLRGCKKYLELIDEDDFKLNIKDYYMAFFWMGLPEICCFAIDRYLSVYVNIPLERFLSLTYLKVEALIELNELYIASDICEDLIFNKPMVDEEKINIMYLLGEISIKLNRKEKAHEAYTWVTKKNPKYRLAKLRLKKIEQGQ
jgi:hypothetical protein